MSNYKIFVFVVVLSAGSIWARPSIDEGKRLIQVSDTKPAIWLGQEEIRLLINNNIHFMDITYRKYPTLRKTAATPNAFPGAIRFQNIVRETFPKISIPWMTEFVTQFSAYHNRYYDSQLGAQSSNWLLNLVETGIAQSEYRGNATARPFNHTWPQNSIIARLQGSESGVVILGAHQDSINSSDYFGRAPGADDNASGCVALLEILLVLLESGFVPKKSIEFHWYAAEERGLLGSQAIAELYYEEGVDVVSMLNYDVISHNANATNQIAFRTDYTDGDLTAFLTMVADEYLTFNRTTGTCGYGCSDHASWTSFGFPAAFIKEASPYPLMHTDRDTIEQVDFVQIQEFVKLGIGYFVELAEPALSYS